MSAFVRQVAALSVLWSLCELLMPSGGQQRMTRLAVSQLVMTALVAALGDWLGGAGMPELPSMPVLAAGTDHDGLTRVAVQSAANQTWRYCAGVAKRAGYRAAGQALLRADGSLEQIVMVVSEPEDGAPLLSPEELQSRLTKALEAEPGRVAVQRAEGQTTGAAAP